MGIDLCFSLGACSGGDKLQQWYLHPVALLPTSHLTLATHMKITLFDIPLLPSKSGKNVAEIDQKVQTVSMMNLSPEGHLRNVWILQPILAKPSRSVSRRTISTRLANQAKTHSQFLLILNQIPDEHRLTETKKIILNRQI